MGVMNAIEKAKTKNAPKSPAMGVWDSLSVEEQKEIRDVLRSEAVGPAKLAELLSDEGVHLGKYFLGKIKREEVSL